MKVGGQRRAISSPRNYAISARSRRKARASYVVRRVGRVKRGISWERATWRVGASEVFARVRILRGPHLAYPPHSALLMRRNRRVSRHSRTLAPRHSATSRATMTMTMTTTIYGSHGLCVAKKKNTHQRDFARDREILRKSLELQLLPHHCRPHLGCCHRRLHHYHRAFRDVFFFPVFPFLRSRIAYLRARSVDPTIFRISRCPRHLIFAIAILSHINFIDHNRILRRRLCIAKSKNDVWFRCSCTCTELPSLSPYRIEKLIADWRISRTNF